MIIEVDKLTLKVQHQCSYTKVISMLELLFFVGYLSCFTVVLEALFHEDLGELKEENVTNSSF